MFYAKKVTKLPGTGLDSNNLKAVLWIPIGSVFNGVPGSGSGFGCKKAKAQKNRKQFKNFIV